MKYKIKVKTLKNGKKVFLPKQRTSFFSGWDYIQDLSALDGIALGFNSLEAAASYIKEEQGKEVVKTKAIKLW